MKIEIDNRYLQLKDVPPGVASYIYESLQITFVTWYKDRYKKTHRKERVLSLSEGVTRYPVGFFSRIKGLLQQKGRDFSIVDNRVVHREVFIPEKSIQYLRDSIRDYQLDAVRAIKKKGGGIVVAATGGGKTFIMACAIAAIKRKTIVIVPNLSLLGQTYDFFVSVFGKHLCGKIGGGDFSIGQLVTVSTLQSLWSFIKKGDIEFIKSIGCLFVDEVHHSAIAASGKKGNTFYQTVLKFDCRYKFGFTATPGKDDDPNRRLLEASVGDIIYDIPASDLVDKGWLAVPDIRMPEFEHIDCYDDWPDAKKNGLTHNKLRNQLIVDSVLEENEDGSGKILIAIDRVEHGKELYKLLRMQTHSVSLLVGSDNVDKRERVLKDFKKGNIQILVSTLLSEGFDFKGLRVVFNAAGGKSEKQTIQRLGRALRSEDGKYVGVCIDVLDRIVVEESNKSLHRHALTRKKTYKDMGFNVKVIK